MNRRSFLLGTGLAALGGVGFAEMLARPLLSTIIWPPDYLRSLTAAPRGGWTQTAFPHAVCYNGVTYFAYEDGTSGDNCISAYNNTTKALTTTVLHAALETDNHDAGTILVRASDQRIVVVYAKHNDSIVRMRVSTNPEDISAFAAEVSLGALGSTNLTYPSVIQLTGESNKIYLFYRDTADFITSKLCFVTSTDGGSTWSARTVLYTNPGAYTYWNIDTNGVDRIDFSVSDGKPDGAPGTVGSGSSIYHFYYLGGSFHKTDGTLITASLPLGPASLTLVYDGSATDTGGFPMDLAASGPTVAFVVMPASGAYSWKYTHWTGSAWTVEDGADITLDATGAADGSVAIQKANPGVVYAVHYDSGTGKWGIRRYVTANGGATWATLDLTPSPTVTNIYPCAVWNAEPGLRAIWQAGSIIRGASTYSVGVVGTI